MAVATTSRRFLAELAARRSPLLERGRAAAPSKAEELAVKDGPLPGADLPWRDWLRTHFPQVCDRPFGTRHERLWEWFEALTPGTRPRPRVEIWPRGGAKSTTTELGCVRSCVRLSRRYVLYVSETQEQADKHVAAIAGPMERAGVERALNIYGHSKGWRRQELRTANGFNVSSLGLDAASRGVKLDQYRPDLVIFDDIDSQDDSARTIGKKIDAITTAIIPAGSIDCAYLFLQNLIHEEGIFAQLLDGRADFLHDREPAYLEPAVHGLVTEAVDRGDGLKTYRITGGAPTWAGQDLAVCERQINAWGLKAFRREAQHEVSGGTGYVFDVSQLRRVSPAEVPPLVSVCLAWDLAATEGAGDWTVGALLGKDKTGRFYVLAVLRGQWASHRVKAAIRLALSVYRPLFPAFRHRLPQDPGQAGKDQADQHRAAFPGAQIEAITGKKAARASGFAGEVNLGNVYLVDQDLPAAFADRFPQVDGETLEIGGKPLIENLGFASWQQEFRTCLRRFREDVHDQQDDDVDAASDAFNELASGPRYLPAAAAGRARDAQ